MSEERFLQPFTVGQMAILLSHYGISDSKLHISYPTQGADNLNILIHTADSRYMLRLYMITPPDEIEFELHLIDDLATRGFPTPRVYRRLDRSLLSEIDGFPCALFDFVEGTPILRERFASLTQVAQLTAWLHQLTKLCRYPGKRNRTDIDHLRNFQRLFAENTYIRNKEGAQEFLRECDRLIQSFDQLLERSGFHLLWGAIHHDLHSGNILVDPEGSILALLDFDEAHLSYLIFDVASLIHYWATDAGRIDEGKAQQLLHAYHASRALSTAESAALADAVLIFFAADAADYLVRSFRKDPDGTELQQCRSLQTFYHLRESDDWRKALVL